MEPVRVGLVGCGMIGQIHADGLRKLSDDGEAVLVGAADPSPDSLEAISRNCPFGYSSDDPNLVIDDAEIEAILIASPTFAHRDLVLATVRAGKALLCEKPLAPSFGEVEELCKVVIDSGLTAQVGFHSRFHPLIDRLRETVVSGELGRPMGYTLRDDQYWPTGDVVAGHSSWRSQRSRAGGGALLEHSIHSADILCWLFGQGEQVHAFSRSVFGYDVEDVAAVSIEHVSGVVGTLLTVFNGVRGREQRRLEVFFEQGAVEVTTDFLVGAVEDSYLVQRPESSPERPDLVMTREKHFERLGITRRDFAFYTYPADRHWVRSIAQHAAASPGFDDALHAHALIEAAYRSSARHQGVAVDH